MIAKAKKCLTIWIIFGLLLCFMLITKCYGQINFIEKDFCRGTNSFNSADSMDNFNFTPDIAAVIADVTENLQVLPAGKEDWLLAKAGDSISFKDRLKTDEKEGKGKLVLSDGSIIKIDKGTQMEFQKKESTIQLILSAGKIWCTIKNEDNIKIEVLTESATASIKGTEFEIEVTGEGATLLTVFKGKVEFANKYGSVIATDNTQTIASKENAPGELKNLHQNEILEKMKWTEFGNPRVMALIEEVNLGKPSIVSGMESSINNELVAAHYNVVDSEQIDLLRQTDDAKKAASGDLMSAASLGLRLKSDIIVTGKVETEYVGKTETGQNTLITCEARCEIKVIIADTAQIILAEKLTKKAVSGSQEAAGKKAIEKLAEKIAGDLIWEIPLNYTIVSKSHRTVQLVFTDCTFDSRNKVIEFIKKLPSVGEKVYPRSFENSIAILDMEYIGTSDDLVKELMKIGEPRIEITGITMNRIEIKILK